MDPVVASAQDTFGINSKLYTAAVEGLSYEELHRRAGPESSPILWIAGHALVSRYSLLQLLGGKDSSPWSKLFSRGSQVIDPDDYPPLEEILNSWARVGDRLNEVLSALGEEELAKKSPRKFPFEDESIRGAIAFLAFHETFHIGQMAYLRKWLGYEGLVG
jgi:uncharacterized damage-inducible protein DinB